MLVFANGSSNEGASTPFFIIIIIYFESIGSWRFSGRYSGGRLQGFRQHLGIYYTRRRFQRIFSTYLIPGLHSKARNKGHFHEYTERLDPYFFFFLGTVPCHTKRGGIRLPSAQGGRRQPRGMSWWNKSRGAIFRSLFRLCS
jgi:hypothetical protein